MNTKAIKSITTFQNSIQEIIIGEEDITANTIVNVIKGTARDDVLSGTQGADEIYGYAGEDDLSGGEGNDIIYGGSGNDTIVGDVSTIHYNEKAGDDVIYGGDGDDVIYGDACWSPVDYVGETGNDVIVAAGAGCPKITGDPCPRFAENGVHRQF